MTGLGVPKLDRSGRGANVGRGDQLVVIQVAIPKNLTAEQEKLFQELARRWARKWCRRRQRYPGPIEGCARRPVWGNQASEVCTGLK